MILFTVLFALLLPPQQDPAAVRMGISVLPETVTVGTPFRILVRVRAPRGSTIDFPAATDSLGGVELLDPRTVRENPDSLGFTDRTATYRLAAWDVGVLPIALGDVRIRVNGAERRVPIDSVNITVETVLPADTAKRIPKPAKDIVSSPGSLWKWYLIAAVAALLLALLLWWWFRRRRGDGAGGTAVDPYAFAEKEFARIEALGLIESGERERFVALMVEVVRDFLARRVPAATESLTSTELARALRSDPTVPLARLEPLLAESDLVKFARAPVSPERARKIGEDARAIVREVDKSKKAQPLEEAA